MNVKDDWSRDEEAISLSFRLCRRGMNGREETMIFELDLNKC